MALSESTPVQVDASGNAESQAKYNTSKSLLLYDNATALRARACDISSGSVSLGTPVDVIGPTSRGAGDVDQLAIGEVICLYNDVDDSNQYKLVVLTISGTSITVETPEDVSTYAGNGSRAFVVACTDSLGFCSVNVGAGEQWARFSVGGVGGTTVTITHTGSPTNSGQTLGLERLDNSRIVRFFGDGFGNASWSIIDIASGITEGTDASDTDRDPKTGINNVHPMVNVDGDKIVTVYTETTSAPDEAVAVVVDTSTGTTITGLGSFLTLTSNATVTGGACCMTDSDTILAYHVGASTTGKIETFDISGTTLTSNADQANSNYASDYTTLELLEDGKALIYWQNHVAIITGIPAASVGFNISESQGGIPGSIV